MIMTTQQPTDNAKRKKWWCCPGVITSRRQ